MKPTFYVKNYNPKHLLRQIKRKFKMRNMYKLWIEKNEPGKEELEAQKKAVFKVNPKISIITPVFNTPKNMLIEMIESVIRQTYSNWELCIADGGSTHAYIKEILHKYTSIDSRIKVKYLGQNKGIAVNSNEAISLATGDFIALLDHDDLLQHFALFEVVKAVNDEPDVECIYSDEDKITENGEKRWGVFFKPDFAPDTLRSYNYMCHFFVFKKDLGMSVGCFREGFDGAQDHDLILRLSEETKKITHIHKVLYHWRAHGNSTAMKPASKAYFPFAGERCINEHLERMGIKGKAGNCGYKNGFYKVAYEITGNPLISIIIPNKDNGKLLYKCVKSILEKSSYRNFEIIIVENMSTKKATFQTYDELRRYKNIEILEWKNKFNFSGINNFAFKRARGEVVLFLNNDTEVISRDWLERMLEHALRKDVGAVGAKLYYSNDTIQHAGIVIGIGGYAGHPHKNFPRYSGGYANRLRIVQNVSGVTGACLMSRKEVIEEVGGFDEGLTVAVNDVDFCLKIRNKGYLIVWTPYAELYHYESRTRGMEDDPEKIKRFKIEKDMLSERWEDVMKRPDPYYNPNLTLDAENLSYKI